VAGWRRQSDVARFGLGEARLLLNPLLNASNERSTFVDENILKGKWHQLKGELKSQWGKLTDDDLDRAEGDAEKLIGRVQERYGYQRDEAKREVDDFVRRHRDLQ
jgi:uncharacterized protein YjbJ (UPF0337 family)